MQVKSEVRSFERVICHLRTDTQTDRHRSKTIISASVHLADIIKSVTKTNTIYGDSCVNNNNINTLYIDFVIYVHLDASTERDLTHAIRVVTPNTHRRRRRDATVELSRVGGVNTIRN